MEKLYAGLDVADRTTAICIVEESGDVRFEAETETTSTAIADVLAPYRRRLKAVGLETGTHADRLHKGLRRLKYPAICLDARYAHSALGARLNKTDANDAKGLALLLVRGIYTTAYVKSNEATRLRTVLMLREAMVYKGVELTRAVRDAKAKLRNDVPQKRKAKTDGERALELVMASVTHEAAAIKLECRRLDSIVEKLAAGHPVCARLMKIPGVGPITALNFVAAVDDPSRFKSSRVVAAYFGLTSRTFQSGLSSRSGGISHRGDRNVRKALYAAGRTVLVRCRTDWALRKWGLQLAKRKGVKIAYVAVARKLAVLMHHLWISGQDFDPAHNAPAD